MNLLESFEELGINKSKKMIYESHDVFFLKFDTNKRIGIKFQNIDIDVNEIKKFRGFYTRALKEERSFFIQTDGNLAERQIFCHMCDFILNEVAKLKTLDEKDLENAIKGWINFGKTNQNNLPESIQFGLFGELLFLSFLRGYYDGRKALLTWHGPQRKKVDFVLSESLAIEIKSISDPLNTTITISSLQQLSDGYKEHFLRVYKLVVTPNGKKLNELFNDLVELFPGDEKDELVNKCCEYGFNYLLTYDNLKPISNVGTNDYAVNNDTFPKLTGEFDVRIVEIKYKISLENQPTLEPNYLAEVVNNSRSS